MMRAEIKQLIEQFIKGDDTSIEVANELEVALDNDFPNDDVIQETVEMLAMYRPEGGESMIDIATITKRLVVTRDYLRTTEKI